MYWMAAIMMAPQYDAHDLLMCMEMSIFLLQQPSILQLRTYLVTPTSWANPLQGPSDPITMEMQRV